MPQVKVYGRRGLLVQRAAVISNAIHASLREAFGIKSEKRFYRFFPLPQDQFMFGPDRSENYMLIEIYLFHGRSKTAKHKLYKTLYARLADDAAIEAVDLEIMLFEVPRENWAIRGIPGDEMELGYEIRT